METNDVLVACTRDVLIGQPTDNLLLHSILQDAQMREGVRLAFFTENKKDFTSSDAARESLKTAEINLHSRHAAAIAWLQHVKPG